MPRPFSLLSKCLYLFLLVGIAFLPQRSVAQDSAPAQTATPKQEAPKEAPGSFDAQPSNSPEQKPSDKSESASFVLGPGDEVEVAVYGAPDLSGKTRVSSDGNISMPLIGYVRVAGLTSSEAEAAIEAQLRHGNILNNPQVSLFVKEYGSSGVSVVGEVVKPGSYSALGPHRLFDVIQAAGGPTDKAANRAVITHRGSDTPVTVELAKDPAKMAQGNVEIQPGDTVVVPAAPVVYVLGEVSKPGGYVLGSGGGVTVLRVVAAAGGPTRDASLGGTRMLRRTPNGLQQIPVPLKNLLRAKSSDIPLEPDDILFVPSSRFRSAFNPGALITTLGAVALYRLP